MKGGIEEGNKSGVRGDLKLILNENLVIKGGFERW
jgi:hypothetical protein